METMQKWEYLTQAVQVADLATLGSDGWRLTAVQAGIMFFERPLAETPPAPAAETPKAPSAPLSAYPTPPPVVPPTVEPVTP